MFQENKPSQEQDQYITWINQQNMTWKANPCLLSKDHPDYSFCLLDDDLLDHPFNQSNSTHSLIQGDKLENLRRLITKVKGKDVHAEKLNEAQLMKMFHEYRLQKTH